VFSAARWDLSYVRRAAVIAVAVTAIGVAWSTAAARDGLSGQAKAPATSVQKVGPPVFVPGHNAQYWIWRINAPSEGTEPARALWITP